MGGSLCVCVCVCVCVGGVVLYLLNFVVNFMLP
jgi:hypothetical protein